jgi:hypothetical protein
MVPGVASGIFWAVPGTAERRGLYRFAVDIGRLALEIADRHGTMAEKWSVILVLVPDVFSLLPVEYKYFSARSSQDLIKYTLRQISRGWRKLSNTERQQVTGACLMASERLDL